MTEKSISLAILGMVAVIAVVGLVMLFNGATANVVSPGTSKVYGGALRQGESAIREIGETPMRYTSPVEDPDLQEYSYQSSYYRDDFQWTRDPCPDPTKPVVKDLTRARDPRCVSSQVRTDVYCCPTGGQSGKIADALYG